MRWLIIIILLAGALYIADVTGVIEFWHTHTIKMSIEEKQATSGGGVRGTTLEE